MARAVWTVACVSPRVGGMGARRRAGLLAIRTSPDSSLTLCSVELGSSGHHFCISVGSDASRAPSPESRGAGTTRLA